MTQRTKAKYGPWVLGEVDESAIYAAASQEFRRSAAVFARNVVFDANGVVHTRPSTVEVAGSFDSRLSENNNFVFLSDNEGTTFIISFRASTEPSPGVHAFDTSTGTWETISSTLSFPAGERVTATQVGNRLYFVFDRSSVGYIERRTTLFSISWEAVYSGEAEEPVAYKQLNGLWAGDPSVDANTIVSIADTGASATTEINAGALPAQLKTPAGEIVTLNSVSIGVGGEQLLNVSTFNIGFHGRKVSLDSAAINVLTYPTILEAGIVTAHKNRLVVTDLFPLSFLYANQEGRVLMSSATDTDILFPSAPLEDSDPIDVAITVDSGSQATWAVANQKYLFIGYRSGVAVIFPDVLTPATISNIVKVAYPLADVPAVGALEYLMAAAADRKSVVAFRYNDIGQFFTPQNVTLQAPKLFSGDVQSLAWVPSLVAGSRGYAVVSTSDKVLIGADISDQQDTRFAWSRLEFAPGSGYTFAQQLVVDGQAWAVVNKNGTYGLVKFVQHSDLAVDTLVIGSSNGSGVFSVPYADGQTVTFVAYSGGDPVASGTAVVTSGSINVGAGNAQVAAGIAFESDIVLPALNVLLPSGHFEGERYRKLRAQLRVESTRQILVENSPALPQMPLAPGTAPPLVTGFFEVPFMSWERDAQLHISGALGHRFSLSTVYVEYEV